MTIPASARSVFLFAALLALAAAPEAPRAPGLVMVGEKEVSAAEIARAPRAEGPRAVIWECGPDGLPELSAAGFVRIKRSGTGFMIADELPRRAADARCEKRRGRIEWGDVDMFRQLAAVIRRLAAAHPDGPRLLIDEISAPGGGFSDFDGDGEADHLTHQTGSNVDILLACKGKPEVEVGFPDLNVDAYDAERTIEVVSLVFEEGALWLTTSAATGIFDRPSQLRVKVTPDGLTATEKTFQVDGGRFATLLLDPRAHGNHMNVAFRPRP